MTGLESPMELDMVLLIDSAFIDEVIFDLDIGGHLLVFLHGHIDNWREIKT